MPQKPFNTKPGAEKRPFKPDIIEKYQVTEPMPLLEFLISVMPQRKRTAIKSLLAHNQVAVNGTPEKQFDTQLRPGQEVKVNLSREFKVFYNRRLKLVYEDDDIIVVNKGYGLLSMGNDKVKEGTAYTILRDYLKWQDPRNKLFIVHRLDRDTSGLMVFAKSIEAKENLQHNWNNMVLSRKYLAVVEGRPDPAEGIVKSYLAENSRYEVYSTDNPDEGQLAITRYRTLKSRNGYSLMEVELDTGRKNQIRVHMKDLGHPITGDRRYGAGSSPIHRMALHAQTLRFVHPITRKDMNFTTPTPISFSKIVGGKEYKEEE
ncbi:RluA family pseudouridine synthase [Duncaniella freteri]|jgi:23S rRNA pseudouridine1911/1915/1917 synthase|uniref:Pseudouridine synthase n=4 Tax=Duncaniella TaxID=2518495 RepID=A0A4Z0V8M5_9BACT|nr:RluA family pseudouridine synthase [Duncaniella freteri]NBJ06180.1 RluA family pseudouridine synthase [Alistipes sp. Z76]NCE68233.1 RluA family pseudouridine synthase [Muribaculaceae bacterium M3]TGG39732.1 RluA family pseudouridine synthase [Duncaniella freteri]